MFAQSVTFRVLKYIFDLFKNSYIFSLFAKLFLRLKNDYFSGRTLKILMQFVAYIKLSYAQSRLKKRIDAPTKLHSWYSSSFLCALGSSIFSICVKLTGSVFGFVERIASGGIIHSFITRVSGKSFFSCHNAFALVIGIMIVCPHEVWNNLYAVILAVGFLTWFFVRVCREKDNAVFSDINFGLIIFVLFATVVSLLSLVKGDAVRIMLFIYSSVIFGLLTAKLGDTKEKLISMLRIICTAVAITAVYGIIQRIMGVEVNPEYIDVRTSDGMPGRVYSTFANPNNFAELLVLFMPLTAALTIFANKMREKYFFAACFVLDFVAIGMSYSRSCWIGLALALFVMILAYDWRLMIPVIFIAIIAVPFLPESIINRILSIGSMQDSSNSYRLNIWSGALKVAGDYFVSGVGAGPSNFQLFYNPIADNVAKTAPHSHMIYMELIIEFGIFATLGFFYYLLTVIRKGLSAIGKAGRKFKMIIAASVGSMIGIMFVCAAEYVWFYPRDMFVFWIVMGVISAATAATVKNQKE